MAELDPNIIMGAQQPQLANPLDAAVKAMTLKDLAQRGQIQNIQAQQAQQDFNDNQTMRNAYNNNTSVDANGNPIQNKQGILKDLATSAPHLVPQVQQKFAEQNANMIENHLKMNNLAIQLLQGANDQQSWTSAKQQAAASGLPVDQIPDQYDPNVKNQILSKSLSANDYLKNQIAQQEVGIKQQDLQLQRDKYSDTKQTDAFKDLMAHAESSRQLPDVKQAYTDRYNSQKVLDLVGSGDPNKLNPNMVQLVSGEVAKIAQGGVPQTEELKNITPNDAQMLMARTKQYLTNHPQASQQGAFVNVFRDYANTIQNGANKVIESNLGQLGESYKDHLKDSDYQNYQNNFIKGNPYSLQQTHEAMNGKSNKSSDATQVVSAHSSMPVGAVSNGYTKTKNGWVQLDAAK